MARLKFRAVIPRQFGKMIKALFRHFMDTNWVMKIVLVWAWVSALIMVLALLSPYYQVVVAAWHF